MSEFTAGFRRNSRTPRALLLAALTVLALSSICFSAMAGQPVNDNFANAQNLSNGVIGSNIGATSETTAGPPAFTEKTHNGVAAASSVWYKWTAPVAGEATISNTAGLNIEIYTGATDAATGTTVVKGSSSVTFRTTATTVYFIVFDGTFQANFTIGLVLNATPANDNFANAVTLNGTSDASNGTTKGATSETTAGPPAFTEKTHNFSTASRSVWYKWTAPATGDVLLSGTTVSSFLNVEVYTGATDAATGTSVVTGNVGFGSATSFKSTSGTVYFIAIDSFSATDFSLKLEVFSVAPANDNFASAVTLTGALSNISGTTKSATSETTAGPPAFTEKTHNFSTARRSVWYKWTPPATGEAILSGTATFSLNVEVYTGATDASTGTTVATASLGFGSTSTFKVTSGTNYFIVVDSSNPTDFTLSLGVFAAPSNDNFATPVVLTGIGDSAKGTTKGATAETKAGPPVVNEKTHSGSTAVRSVWYKWNAPVAGKVTITNNQSLNTEVYTGATDAFTGTTVATGFSTTTFQAVAATDYFIAIDGFTPTDFIISISEVAPPANDNFANAITLAGTEAEIVGTTVAATAESKVGPPVINEKKHNSATAATSVWYKWTAPIAGNAVLSNDGLGLNMEIYTGATDAFTGTTVAKGSGSVSFSAVASTVYFIAIDGFERTFLLNISVATAPTNDNFATPVVLTGSPVYAYGTTAGATKEVGEFNFNNTAGGNSVWYNWTAPAAGTANIRVIDNNFNGNSYTVAVYTGGTSAAMLSPAVFRGSGASATSGATVAIAVPNVASGTVLQIVVDSKSGASSRGTFQIGADLVPAPANDNFANAIDLGAVATFAVTGNTIGSTSETVTVPAPVTELNAPTGSRTIWYKWTSPTSRNVIINTKDSVSSPSGNIYTGTSLSNLVSVGTLNNNFSAIANTAYFIQVIENGTAGTIKLNLPAAPANDNLANAITITGATFNIIGDTTGATSETVTGPPAVTEPGSPTASIWYKWTAPAAGPVRLNTIGSEVNASISVYTDLGANFSVLPTPLVVTGNDTVQFTSVAGTTYFIRLNSTAFGKVALNLPAAPANDNFANAIDLGNVKSFNVVGNNTGATNETTTGPNGITDPSSAASIWYKWTSPVTQSLEITASGTTLNGGTIFNPGLAIYTGASVGALTPVPNDGTTSVGVFTFTANTVYFITVGGSSSSSSLGDIRLTLNAAPVNDNFANAIAVSGDDTINGNTTNATVEAGEPGIGLLQASTSVWYNWTPKATGKVTITLNDINGAGMGFGIFTGSAVNALTLVGQSGGFVGQPGFGDTKMSFIATAGTVYRVAVDGFFGPFSLNFQTSPVNDDFANKIALTGATFSVTSTALGATKEPSEPGFSSQTVWYSWTAPADGTTVLTVSGGSANVYTGTALNSLALVSQIANSFKTVANTVYQIQVSSPGQFTMTTLPLPPNDNFANAITLSGATFDIVGYNFGATLEPGESTVNASVWYSWTAPANAHVALLCSAQFQVYTGTAVNALKHVVVSSVDTNGNTFDAVGGTKYMIAVGGSPQSFGLKLFQRPVNDDFAASIPMVPNPKFPIYNGNNFGATSEAGEPTHDFVVGGLSVWYNWTAPIDGKTSIVETTFNGMSVAVYTGTAVGSLTRVASGNSIATFVAVKGTVYQIALDSNFSTYFTVEVEQAPTNDFFANALALTGDLPITNNASNFFATTEPGEPNHAGLSSSSSVWFSYTPTSTHRLEVTGAQAVYTGTSVSGLTVVGESPIADVQWDAVAGTTYFIATAGSQGFFQLIVSNANISKTSALVATPVPAVETETVTFTIGTDASETFEWDFGDGTKTITATGTTSHVYNKAGTYTATVKASISNKQSVSDSVSVTVLFQKDVNLSKASITLGFDAKSAAKDKVILAGALTLGSSSTSGDMTINVGGLSIKKTLASGKLKTATEAISLAASADGKNSKFSITLVGNFKAAFAAAGLTKTAVKNKPTLIPVQIIFNGTSYEFDLNLVYTSSGKKGVAN